MVQGAAQTSGRFEEEVRMYKAPPPEVSSEDFYETDPTKPYQRGFSIQNISPLPITHAEHITAQGHWGEVLREYMRDYVHWATLGSMCEFLARYDNAVTLAERTDRFGLPVARFAYTQCDNDRLLLDAAQEKMEEILTASGAAEVMTIKRYAHLVGGCRMSTNENDGVVDGNLRAFAVPNLLVTDGSVLPTQGSANPGLTIMALAARCADQLIAGARAGINEPRTPEVTEATIAQVEAAGYQIPTGLPEADGTCAVVMEPEGRFAVAKDVSDRTVGLARVQHGGRSVMAEVLELQLGSATRHSPTIAQRIRPHRHGSVKTTGKGVLRIHRLDSGQFLAVEPLADGARLRLLQ
jgi:GMC oxidoreductase